VAKALKIVFKADRLFEFESTF